MEKGRFLQILLDHASVIDLSHDQVGKINALKIEQMEALEKLRQEKHALSQELHQMMDEPKPKRKKIHQKISQIQKIQEKMMVKRVDTKLDALGLLNEKQKAELQHIIPSQRQHKKADQKESSARPHSKKQKHEGQKTLTPPIEE